MSKDGRGEFQIELDELGLDDVVLGKQDLFEVGELYDPFADFYMLGCSRHIQFYHVAAGCNPHQIPYNRPDGPCLLARRIA